MRVAQIFLETREIGRWPAHSDDLTTPRELRLDTAVAASNSISAFRDCLMCVLSELLPETETDSVLIKCFCCVCVEKCVAWALGVLILLYLILYQFIH